MTFWAHHPAPRILVIDDNPSIHRDFDLVLLDDLRNAELEADEQRLYGQTTRPTLAAPPYRLEHAFSGLEGVEKVKQALAEECPYQVAFVDIRMPGIDGVETIERIWQIDTRLQIVICTAFSDYSWEDLARRLGPTDKLLVLKKPFDNIEVILLASTLSEKWFLARQAALKHEQMELLVAQRTRSLLEIQRSSQGLPPTADTLSRGSLAVQSLQPEHADQHPRPEECSPAMMPENDPSGGDCPVILLAEEDQEFGGTITENWAGDYRVVQVTDGEQGLRQARDFVPDLVITAFPLPVVDGIEVCRLLKSDGLTSHIPVVVVAATASEAAQVKALEAGADDYLARPLALPVLRARVDNLLRAHQGVHEHFPQELGFQPRDLAINQADALFLRRMNEIVEKHLADFEFDVDVFAQKTGVSRRQLFRKLKAVTGCTPNAFLRRMRLNRAAQLLRDSQMTVTEITYAVGFSDLKHFRSVFREQFGASPAEYTKRAPRKTPA